MAIELTPEAVLRKFEGCERQRLIAELEQMDGNTLLMRAYQP